MFNYYENSKEFIGWALVSLIAGYPKEKFEELSEKTNTWSEVDLKISINGVEVPTEHFMESVENNMKYWAEQTAEKKVEDVLDKVTDKVYDVENLLDDLARTLRDQIKQELEK